MTIPYLMCKDPKCKAFNPDAISSVVQCEHRWWRHTLPPELFDQFEQKEPGPICPMPKQEKKDAGIPASNPSPSSTQEEDQPKHSE